jgi:Flp pilus assembly protein TadG
MNMTASHFAIKDVFSEIRKRESGQALVETAMVLPLLFLLILGIGSSGICLYYWIEISNAAHAGAVYGIQNSSNASSSSGIQYVARQDASDFGSNLTVTSTPSYVCTASLNGTSYSSSSSAITACGGSAYVAELITVTTSASVSLPLSAPALGFPSSYTLTGRSVMEVLQ